MRKTVTGPCWSIFSIVLFLRAGCAAENHDALRRLLSRAITDFFMPDRWQAAKGREFRKERW